MSIAVFINLKSRLFAFFGIGHCQHFFCNRNLFKLSHIRIRAIFIDKSNTVVHFAFSGSIDTDFIVLVFFQSQNLNLIFFSIKGQCSKACSDILIFFF